MALADATTYAAPGEPGSPVELKERDDDFIGGGWTAPSTGEYQYDVTPSTREPLCEVAHSGADDIELALDAAHVAKDEWGRRSPAERAAVLHAVATGSRRTSRCSRSRRATTMAAGARDDRDRGRLRLGTDRTCALAVWERSTMRLARRSGRTRRKSGSRPGK
jgi:acyl-CoA reductase-like NAD-dependent aldehyde dehydrogenase